MASRDIVKEYKEVFDLDPPYLDFGAPFKPMNEWRKIMIECIDKKEPYLIEYEDGFDY